MSFAKNIKRSSGGGSGGGNYVKLVQGENKFRIVGSTEDKPYPGLITGMIGWGEDEEGKRKPFRYEIDGKPPIAFADKPKEFFAMIVWSYAESKLMILEIAQAGLKDKIIELAEDADWGDPRKYDVSIVRNGEGLETSYVMTPKPMKKRSAEINDAVSSMNINLLALFEGGDPFSDEAPSAPEAPEEPETNEDGSDPF